MAEQLDALKHKRSVIKSQLTRFQNYLGKLSSDPDIKQIEIRLSKEEPLFEEFNEIQSKIELLDVGASQDANDTERETFEDKYFYTIATAKRLIENHNEQILNARAKSACSTESIAESRRLASVASSSSDGDVDQHQSQIKHSQSQLNSNALRSREQIRLPKLDLPTFDGSYSQWLFFRDTFSSIIGENATISQIQKFHYLRLSLKGEAADVISSLEISADNYNIAWDLLLERYENKSLLIGNHVKKLFSLSSITKESCTDLRSLLDSATKHLRALEVLGKPVSQWDTLLIHIIVNKLDTASRREWESKNTGNELPTFKSLADFLKQRCRLLEALQTSTDNNRHQFKPKLKACLSTNNIKCVVCKESHLIYNCPKFLNLTAKDRLNKAKDLRLCINCLRKSHAVGDCKSSSCRKCDRQHHSLLHFENTQVSTKTSTIPPDGTEAIEQTSNQSSVSSNHTVSTHATNGHNTYALLSTAVIQALDKDGKPHDCRALLDSGSECSFITEQLCDKLQLERCDTQFSICGIGKSLTTVRKRCEVKFQSKHNSFKATITCLILPKITENVPCFAFNRQSLDIPPNIQLADPCFDQPQQVDMLLGVNIFWDLLKLGRICLGKNKPSLQKTHLGWLVSGQVPCGSFPKTVSSHLVTNSQMSEKVERFWELEQIDSSRKLLPEEEACEHHFRNTFKRDCNGRFIVSIPFKMSPDQALGHSKEQTELRFYNLERKLQRDPSLKERYTDFLNEYERLGHMTKVHDEDDTSGYYMPHHGVLREDKSTTKLRVVFDASAPTSSGVSINQIQMVGPVIQNDLLSIILRFRKHQYAISADISKMYRQVLITEEHRKYQKILWRPQPTDKLSTYLLNTVTYGTASASFLAIRCLHELAQLYSINSPRIAEIITSDFYVDDLLSGANSFEEASTLCREIYDCLRQGGFELAKWRSNDQRVISGLQKKDNSSNAVDFGATESLKTLGLTWCSERDALKYTIKPELALNKVTKRTILSETAEIFDPLGLLSPCTILAKIIIQKLWMLKISWDESIPFEINSSWRRFRNELKHLNEIDIPRRVICSNPVKVELHGFSDASEMAYGACVYVRSIDANGKILVRLLCAKTRVAPLKTTTMPRLELCAALLLAQLSNKILTSMKIQFTSIHHWTDSSIVLSWIRSIPAVWKIFVSNRVSQIQNLTKSESWNYVNTKCNPADLLSRGVEPKNISDLPLWWEGPSWLSKPDNEWPQIPANLQNYDSNNIPEIIVPELKRNDTACHLSSHNCDFLQKFSSFTKLQRTIAYCLRFKTNCLQKGRCASPLTAEELKEATMKLIFLVQRETFAREISELQGSGRIGSKSKILALDPFLDSEGILRVGGRLRRSNYPLEKRHPAILPAKHHFSSLLVEHEHLRLFHAGPQSVLSSLRERFWIVSGRSLIRQVIHRCLRCFRFKADSVKYLMADLPSDRVTPARPFVKCGVDYCGPFLIRDRPTRNYKTTKAYVCLFICLVTKAVHLELVSTLSTDSFLSALRRFCARRGKCISICSDNATNFVGADKELKKFLKEHEQDFQTALAQDGISWNFIPPRAPHFGGIWEAGIKSVKGHLKRVIGNALLTYEEFSTILVQIESCLNSRPLHPLSADPSDPNPLTPSHFIIGETLTATPEGSYVDLAETRLNRFRRLQKMFQHFWQRWHRDYIGELQTRVKWKRRCDELLKPGVLVLVKEDNTPPLKWCVGRVLEVLKGADDVVRVVVVKTAAGVFKRPAIKLCVLPNQQDVIS